MLGVGYSGVVASVPVPATWSDMVYKLRPSRDMAIGDSHGLRAPTLELTYSKARSSNVPNLFLF